MNPELNNIEAHDSAGIVDAEGFRLHGVWEIDVREACVSIQETVPKRACRLAVIAHDLTCIVNAPRGSTEGAGVVYCCVAEAVSLGPVAADDVCIFAVLINNESLATPRLRGISLVWGAVTAPLCKSVTLDLPPGTLLGCARMLVFFWSVVISFLTSPPSAVDSKRPS